MTEHCRHPALTPGPKSQLIQLKEQKVAGIAGTLLEKYLLITFNGEDSKDTKFERAYF